MSKQPQDGKGFAPRMQHCFNCGAELGVFQHYIGDEPECCSSTECNRELRYMMQSERAEREQAAADDDYRRYP